MDCIPYINDLQIEIQILKDVKANGNCNVDLIEEKIDEKEKLIEKCKDNLSKLSNKNVEYRLYLYIINGLSPTKAVERIANENLRNNIKPADVSTIWTNYYKKIKKYL